MAVRIVLLAGCILLFGQLPAVSRGSGVSKDEPWNSHHIDELPADIRHYIASI